MVIHLYHVEPLILLPSSHSNILLASAQLCQIGAPANGRTSTPALQGKIAKPNNLNEHRDAVWHGATRC